MDETPEIWKPIPSLPNYSASNTGRIRSEERRVRCDSSGMSFLGLSTRLEHGRILKNNVHCRGGYLRVRAGGFGKLVHRLVLEAFRGPCPDGLQTRHIDGNPTNNHIDNLRWGTPQENADDKDKNGPRLQGETHGRSKLTNGQVREIRASTDSARDLAQRFGVVPHSIQEIRRRKTWSHLN